MEDNKLAVQPTFAVRPDMAETQKLVKEMMSFIKQNRLSSNIAGKNYLQVEAWQFVGSQLDLTAIVTELKDITKVETVPRYQASVEIIHNPTGKVVSRGFAMCSKAESKKKSFDEYSIASMAQTRAIGKAYRNILAWLVKMAGYEGTPAEEISDNIRDDMKTDLAKIKLDVFNKFKEKGITNSQDMLAIIQKATGKQLIESADDAMSVLAELEDSEVQDSK